MLIGPENENLKIFNPFLCGVNFFFPQLQTSLDKPHMIEFNHQKLF